MKLITGLGNPGDKYQSTRHNLGHMVVDSLVGEEINARLYKPRAFMNLSGPEVAEQLSFHKLGPGDLLVIHDDLDLPYGEVRLQIGKSSAGHHGVDSIIEELGTNAFWRLRLGIGPRGDTPGDEFVLENFTPKERESLDEIISRAKEKTIDWLKTEQKS